MTANSQRPETIRSAFLYDAHDLRIERVPHPPIPPRHVAIATKFCGICGSDLQLYHCPDFAASLKQPHPLTGCTLPIAFGHEFSGVVTELGEGCSGSIAVGDKVVAIPTLTDGVCPSCIEGHDNTCVQLGFVGINTKTGGMSERTVVAEDSLLKLPASIDCDVGALIEPLAVAWHAVSLVDDLPSCSTALIIGAGPVGCAVLLTLQARPTTLTQITISDPSPTKLTLATHLGASKTHNPSNPPSLPDSAFDLIFDCAGSLPTAISCIKPRQTIINLALPPTSATTINLMAMMMKEVVLKSSMAYTRRDFVGVLGALEEGRLRGVRGLVTKVISLEDLVGEEGGLLRLLGGREGGECKVLVDLGLGL